MLRRSLSSTLAVVFLLQSAPAFAAFSTEASPIFTAEFASAMDAFSFRLPEDTSAIRYSYYENDHWSSWQAFEDDGDRMTPESELVMLPYNVTKIRMQGIDAASDIHPLTVSKDLIRVRTAAREVHGIPSVLSRTEWGADDQYLFSQSPDNASSSEDAAKGDNGSGAATDSRAKDCIEAQQKYAAEFAIHSTTTTDAQGRKYRWPLQYSKKVQLLVVHHSALKVEGDPRPPAERVRALYKYHAINRGWGDIGYHYVVDENGQVYEGRTGGNRVVGGHAYCNNVGTIGVVLMGNFELEQPSQAQAKGLQRLLADLAKEYDIDTNRAVQFHGKKFASPIVGHRDLLSTLCPGTTLYAGIGQIVSNVRSGNIHASVLFPSIQRSSSSSSLPPQVVQTNNNAPLAEGVRYNGRTSISINPGGKQRLSFQYTAGEGGAYERKKIADIRLSVPTIYLWQDDSVYQVPISKSILLDSDVPAGETVSIQLIVQAPMDAGTYWMDIGGLRFTLLVTGRRARTGVFINPFSGDPSRVVVPATTKPSASRISRLATERVTSKTSSSMSSSIASSSASTMSSSSASASATIRLRLSATPSPTVTFTEAGMINGTRVPAGTAVHLIARGNDCVALDRGAVFTNSPILRLSPSNSNALTIDAVRSKIGMYKGVTECRIINGSLALINELPMEDYLMGLAEEPDTEPHEKQRAFAIAARTYAAYYLTEQRKFPGLPYDGSDDPATFQSYLGVHFAGNNPRWVRAVQSTAHQVLRSANKLIKPPYFSSDDGRTRSPAEAGWKSFPFSEIFTSKPDPWCSGMSLAGHGVGMSGCGAKGQAKEGRSAEQILSYYYPGTRISDLR